MQNSLDSESQSLVYFPVRKLDQRSLSLSSDAWEIQISVLVFLEVQVLILDHSQCRVAQRCRAASRYVVRITHVARSSRRGKPVTVGFCRDTDQEKEKHREKDDTDVKIKIEIDNEESEESVDIWLVSRFTWKQCLRHRFKSKYIWGLLRRLRAIVLFLSASSRRRDSSFVSDRTQNCSNDDDRSAQRIEKIITSWTEVQILLTKLCASKIHWSIDQKSVILFLCRASVQAGAPVMRIFNQKSKKNQTE